VKQSIRIQLKQQKIYNAFLSLLTCYYTRDYFGVYMIRKHLGSREQDSELSCTLSAASLVLQKTFGKPKEKLVKQVFSFYNNQGGFMATKTTRVADLLSTAVALYSLYFAGADLRKIRPACLEYVDSLFQNGGFSANSFDPDTDIEYTFYGLLALGALA
jgi:prenyltransferase beta subunit